MRLSLTLNENPNEDSASAISLIAMMRDEESLPPLLDYPFLEGGESVEPGDTETDSTLIPDEAAIPLADVLDDIPELGETTPDSDEEAEEGPELADDSRSGRQLLVEYVLVQVVQPIRDGVLPFAFDVIEPDPTHRRRRSGSFRVELPVLRIVAAPGVHIQVARATNAQAAFYVDVIRVQDVRILPEPGEPIDIGQYLQTNGVPMRHDTDWGRDFLNAYNQLLALGENGFGFEFTNTFTGEARTIEFNREELNDFLRDKFNAYFPEDMARVSIIPIDDGTIFYDSLCKRVLRVKVPRMSLSGAAESGNARARYGYTVNQSPLADFKSVIIAATADVEVIQYCFVNSVAIAEADINQDAENLANGIDAAIQRALARGEAPVGATGLTLEQIQMDPFVLYRVPQLEFVPNPGETIRPVIDFRFPRPIIPGVTPSSLGRHITPREPWTRENIRYESPSSLTRELTHIGVDVGIGLIPVVGDLTDISEVLVAAFTGRDHWGDRVGPFEITLMTIGAILPFTSNRSVRTLGTLIMGGALASAAAPLIDPEGDEAHEADAERGLE